MIHYQNVTIGKKFWMIEEYTLEIKTFVVTGIEVIPKFDGRTEKIILDKTVLLLSFNYGKKRHHFNLNKKGGVITDDTPFFIDHTTAKEEQIIERTKENRESHLGE
jgi:hypothetical protein